MSGHGMYAVKVLGPLWKGCKWGDELWDQLVKDVDALGIDERQIDAVVAEHRRKASFLKYNEIYEAFKRATPKRQAVGDSELQKAQYARKMRGKRLLEAFNRHPQKYEDVTKAEYVFGHFEKLADNMIGQGLWSDDADDLSIIENALTVIRRAPDAVNPAKTLEWLATVSDAELVALAANAGSKRIVNRELLERHDEWRLLLYRRAVGLVTVGAGVVNVRRDLGEVNRNEREQQLAEGNQ